MYHILNDEEYIEYRKLKEGVYSCLSVMKEKRYRLNVAIDAWEKEGCKEIANGIRNQLHGIDFAINELNKVI